MICPSCRQEFQEGGTSRLDNKTYICGECCEMEAAFSVASPKEAGYAKSELCWLVWHLMLRLYYPPPVPKTAPPPKPRSIDDHSEGD